MNLMNIIEYEYSWKSWKKMETDENNKQNKTNKTNKIKGRTELHLFF